MIAGSIHPSEQTPSGAQGEDFRILLSRAAAYLHQNRIGEARLSLERALRLHPEDEQARNLLGLSLFRLGDLGGAESIFLGLVRSHPDDASLRLNLAMVLLKGDKFSAAREELERAIDLNPNHARAAGFLGLTLERLAAFDEAATWYEVAGQAERAEEMRAKAAAHPREPDLRTEEPAPPPSDDDDVPEPPPMEGIELDERHRVDGPVEAGRPADETDLGMPPVYDFDLTEEMGAFPSAAPEPTAQGRSTGAAPPDDAAPLDAAAPSGMAPLGGETEAAAPAHGDGPQLQEREAAEPGAGTTPAEAAPTEVAPTEVAPTEAAPAEAPPAEAAPTEAAPTEAAPTPAGQTAPEAETSQAEVPHAGGQVQAPGTRATEAVGGPSSSPLHGSLRELLAARAEVLEPEDDPRVEGSLLRLPVRGKTHVRSDLVVHISGDVEFTPVFRRYQGETTEGPFGGERHPVVALQGLGLTWLDVKAFEVSQLYLREEELYLVESAVLAFGVGFEFENGRLPGEGGQDLDLVHLQGAGYLALGTRAPLHVLPVRPRQPVRVPCRRLVGFRGDLMPYRISPAELASPKLRTGLRFDGEGEVLVW